MLIADRDIVVRLDLALGAPATLRRDRKPLAELHLKRCVPYDVAAKQSVSEEVARAAVRAAPDLKRYRGLISVVGADADDAVRGVLSGAGAVAAVAVPVELALAAPAPAPELAPEPILAPPPALPPAPEQPPPDNARHEVPRVDVPVTATPPPLPTILLEEDPDAGSEPTMRWSRERLFQFAKSRGLRVDDTMTKQVLLRRIRAAS